MSAANTTLREAVTKAVAEVGVPDNPQFDESTETGTTEQTTEESTEETTQESTEESTEETSDTVEIEMSQAELDSALSISRILADPNAKADFLRKLATEAGYDLTKPAEVKKFEKDTKAVFREKLGDHYDLVNGDAIADAFDTLLEERVNKITKPVLDKIQLAENEANNNRATTAMETFFSRNKIPTGDREKVAAKLVDKMKSMVPAPGTDPVIYLEDLYTLVTKKDVVSKTTKETVERINKNAQGAERKTPGSGPDEKRVTVKVKRLPTLKESVQAAARGERLVMD